MRILHVGKYYPPAKGGMETALRHIVEGLQADGHAVAAIVAGGPRWRSRGESLGDGGDHAAGILWRAATPATWLSQPLTPTLPALLARAVADFAPDLVHLHLPNPAACWAWRWTAAGARGERPGLAVWYHADITRQKLTGRLVRPLVRDCLGRAAGICVSSASLADHSAVLAPWRSKVVVIPFGIDPDPWQTVSPDPAGPFLFVGRLVPYKGLDTLVAAVGALPAARLDIVGAGPVATTLRRTVRARGWSDRIRLLGEVPDAELPALMARCRALCLPSRDRSETFGLILLEAMAAGLPLITSRLATGVAEVNREGETGWAAAPGDVDDWRRVLAQVMEAPAAARERGETGRQRVRARFGRDRMATALTAWYHGLVAGVRRNSGRATGFQE